MLLYQTKHSSSHT